MSQVRCPALPGLPELYVALVLDPLFQCPLFRYLPHGTFSTAQLHNCTVALIVLHEHPSLDSAPPILTAFTVPCVPTDLLPDLRGAGCSPDAAVYSGKSALSSLIAIASFAVSTLSVLSLFFNILGS